MLAGDRTRYAARMGTGSHWGGAIEMAVFALVMQLHVHVFERRGGGFARISAFVCNGDPMGTVHVLYSGRCHYDGLEPR
jgi:hypothetical protein